MKPQGSSYKAPSTQRNRRLGSVTRRWLAGLGLSTGIALTSAAAHAEPRGGEVVSGAPVTIEVNHDYVPGADQPGALAADHYSSFTNIETQSHRTGIQWDSFDIGETEGVYFDQPSTDATTWNFVSSPSQTVIEGYLGSNGRVGVSNPSGLYIGGQAIVSVAELIAAAGELTPEAFETGELHFTDLGPLAVAQGAQIGATDSVSLIGRSVANHGSIVARDGSIAMLAGDEVWISQHGSPIRIHMTGGSAGDEQPAVENTGDLTAARGRVRLAAGDFLAMAVRNTGDIAASEISIEGGQEGLVTLSGTLTARDEAGRRGGRIEVAGDWIALRSATLDASGDEGGGTVLVGGQAQGQGDTARARGVYASRDTSIRADALEKGDGGEIVLWGDEVARIYGDLSARGGPQGGDGGFVETSSRGTLVVAARIDAGAPLGEPGLWLLDPVDVTITDDPGDDGLEGEPGEILPPVVFFRPDIPDSLIDSASIINALEAGTSVLVTTAPELVDVGDQDGDILVESPLEVGEIRGGNDVALRLQAAGDITIESDAPITHVSDPETPFENGLTVILEADRSGQGELLIGAEISTGGGDLYAGGTNVTIGPDAAIDTTYHGHEEDRLGGDVTLVASILENPEDGGEIRVDAPITTDGGDFLNFEFTDEGVLLPGGRTFTSTESGVIDTRHLGGDEDSQGTISVYGSDAVAIGAELISGEIGLQAGSSGSGNLDITGQTLTGNEIFLTAGRGVATAAGEEAPRIISSGASFKRLDDEAKAPEVFSYRQDGAIADADIPDRSSFGDGSAGVLDGMAYTIGSFGSTISLQDPDKVDGTDLTLFAEGDITGPDDAGACVSAICIGAEIQPQAVSITVTGDLAVSDELANVLKPQGGLDPEGETVTSGISLHAGWDGEGDLSFLPDGDDPDDAVVLTADRIELRAGIGNGSDDTATVDAVTNSPRFQNLGGSGNPSEFTVRQDAEIFDLKTDENDEEISGSSIPHRDQFGAGTLADMVYTLRSDAGNIRISTTDTVADLAESNLTLLTADEIDVADLLDDSFPVTSLELGGVRDFTVTSEVLSKFQVLDNPNDGDRQRITLRSGAGDTGHLYFESGVVVAADEIRLVAGDEQLGTSGSIFLTALEPVEGEEESYEPPIFSNPDEGPELGAPERFVFQQTNPVFQSQLPSVDQFQANPAGEVEIDIYGIRSAGSSFSRIELTHLRYLTAMLTDNSGTENDGKLILSSPTIAIERSDVLIGDKDLVLDHRHQLRGDYIVLATREPPEGDFDEEGPVVDAIQMTPGSINGFDEDEFELDEPPGSSPISFWIRQRGGFTVDNDGFSTTLPDPNRFGGGLAPVDRDPVEYALVSLDGTCLGTCGEDEEIGIQIDPSKFHDDYYAPNPDPAKGADLFLRLGGFPTLEEGDEGEDFRNVGTIDFKPTPTTGALIVNSLDARTTRDFEVAGSRGTVQIIAAESIQLWAGGTLQDTEVGTDIGIGDLSFEAGVELEAEDIVLRAGFTDSNSVVYAQGNEAGTTPPTFVLTAAAGEETSFTQQQTGSIRNLPEGDPGKYSAPPLSAQFKNTGGTKTGLESADTFQLISLAGEIEIGNPSEIGIGSDEDIDAIDRPGHLILAARDVTIREENTDLVLGGMDITLAGTSIKLWAPAGQVIANDERAEFEDFQSSYLSPESFTIQQGDAIAGGSSLPDPSQFRSSLEDTTYKVQSDFAGAGDTAITVDAEFAAKVTRSQLLLQASDGKHIAIHEDIDYTPPPGEDPEFAVDLDLVSLRFNPDTADDQMPGMQIQFGTDGSDPDQIYNIKTDEPQIYSNPVILVGGTARLEVVGIGKNIGEPFNATMTFEESVDGQDADTTGSLLIVARDVVTFHESIGGSVPLDTFQFNVARPSTESYDSTEILPIPRVEFGPSEPDVDFQVRARQIFLNPDPGSEDALADGLRRLEIPPVATFFRRQGNLTFQAGREIESPTGSTFEGGTFQMGRDEKISVADGNLTINTYGGGTIPDEPEPGEAASDYGEAFLGDLSAAGDPGQDKGEIQVESGVIHMLLRHGGSVLRANGRVEEDVGVDYVANEIDFDFIVEDGDASRTLEKNQIGNGKRARFAILNQFDAPEWMDRFPVAGINYNILANPDGEVVFDGVPDGTPRAGIWPALSDRVPLPRSRNPLAAKPVDPARLAEVGIRPRPVSNAEHRSWLSGAAIYDDLTTGTPPGGPEVVAVEARLVSHEAVRAAELYSQVFGADGSRAPAIRATLQSALDDYRRSTGARRVVGFEFRRYINNRPSSQFEAYLALQNLDALFRHHRRSGLTAAEYRGIQRSWLEHILPEGITLEELAEVIHPSRYVRGSDVLDVFGD